MKKGILTITVICYLAVTGGILVNFHYCMDRLASTQFFVAENTRCPKCGMHIVKSHGCCRDEVKIIKMKVDQKTPVAISFELPALASLVAVPSEFIAAPFVNNTVLRYPAGPSPPLLSGQDAYLQHCVFRI